MNDLIYTETYRPQFHFTAEKNWLNDPNGLVYYAGEYHLFFQHNPVGIDWGNMTWGHAVSPDLVHWTQLDNALEPDALGTMFSGSAVVDWNNTAGFAEGAEPALIAMYTAAGGTSPESQGVPFTQCLAYSNDKGRTWTKWAQNPVLQHMIAENRDPKVVWYAPSNQWVMALYLDKEEFALFTSPDLKQWTHIQTLSLLGASECPDLFPITVQGESTIRWIITGANGRYLIGEFDGAQFIADAGPQVADYGANYYAVQTFSDIPASDGRRIQIAWMNGGKYPDMGFSQQMSFPCELTLHREPEGLRMYRIPVKEIELLHADTYKQHDLLLAPDCDGLSAAGLSGDVYDISVEFEPEKSATVVFRIRGEEVVYNCETQSIACLGKTAPLGPIAGRVRIRLLVDRTSIELFGNDGRLSMTSCFCPPPDNHGMSLHVTGSTVCFQSVNVHTLRSAWL